MPQCILSAPAVSCGTMRIWHICILQIQITATRIFQHARCAHQSQILKEHTKTRCDTIWIYVCMYVCICLKENNKYLLLLLYFTPLSRQIQPENKSLIWVGEKKSPEKYKKQKKTTPCYALHFSVAFSFLFSPAVSHFAVCWCYSYLFVALVIKFSLFPLALAISHLRSCRAAKRLRHHVYFPLFKKNFRMR